jgi:sugar phosphate isomerase/epimerase
MAETLAGDGRYAGIEAEFPADPADQSRLAQFCREASLGFIPLLLIDGETPDQQLEDFRARAGQALQLDPNLIVVHSGRDVWSLEESLDFYGRIVELEQELGCRVAHETHRGRPLGTPWATAEILELNPQLRLCCDFSHWVVVCERLLGDLEQIVAMAADRAIHLHARVGSDQTPQVQDPASPAAAECLAAFEGWWGLVWDAQQRAGVDVATVTPEYGPPPYQPEVGDDQLLAERLSVICDWQADQLRTQFDGRMRITNGT